MTAPPRLVVLGDAAGNVGPWRDVVASLAAILRWASAVEPVAATPGPERVEAALRRAAAVAGPVLVLPGDVRRDAHGRPQPTLRRVLAPFDASEEVSACSGALLARLQTGGVEVAQLHVVTGGTVPAMWEGAGHHATAWRAELRRRHQVGDAPVEIVLRDPPADVVLARAGHADLVVLCWRRTRSRGRADLVRRVLASSGVPTLLLPLPGPPAADTGTFAP